MTSWARVGNHRCFPHVACTFSFLTSELFSLHVLFLTANSDLDGFQFSIDHLLNIYGGFSMCQAGFCPLTIQCQTRRQGLCLENLYVVLGGGGKANNKPSGKQDNFELLLCSGEDSLEQKAE